MKVKLKKQKISYGIKYKIGDTMTVRDEIGEKWIKNGEAEAITTPKKSKK